MFVACVLALCADKAVTSYVWFAAPIGVQELVHAVWQIVRGFSSTSTPTLAQPLGGRVGRGDFARSRTVRTMVGAR